MANVLYDFGRNEFLEGNIAWTTDDIKVVLVDGADYTPNTSTDEDLADIPVGGRVATSANLSGKTAVGGTADAADVTFTSVTGDQSEYLVIYKDSGVEATSTLIALIDTATGLPVTPNGGDITVTWSGSGIFKL